MKVKSVEKLEKSRVALIIEADVQEFEGAIEKAYRKQRSRIMLPGFRKGKAPRKMIEAMYGAEIFYEDAVNEIYPELFDQAVVYKRQRPLWQFVLKSLWATTRDLPLPRV